MGASNHVDFARAAYELRKDILDPNVKDSKKKVETMIGVAGAFMGGYDYYKKKITKI